MINTTLKLEKNLFPNSFFIIFAFQTENSEQINNKITKQSIKIACRINYN